MAKELPPFVQKVLDKFSNSRDFTISFALHAILVAIVWRDGSLSGGAGAAGF